MKVWKKCGVLFLTVLLCITMMAVPALAASDSQDGLEVTLTTDKEKYSKSEEIAATLTVRLTVSPASKDSTCLAASEPSASLYPSGIRFSNDTLLTAVSFVFVTVNVAAISSLFYISLCP